MRISDWSSDVCSSDLERIDDAVVPQPGRRIIGMALLLILGADRSLESLLVVRRPVVAPRGAAVAADGGEPLGRLPAAHPRDAPFRPQPTEHRAVGAPAHAVVAGTEAAAAATR